MNRIKKLRPVIVVAVALVALVAIAFVSGALDSNANGPIGYVDGMRLLSEYRAFAELNELYDAEVAKLQAEFDEESKNMTTAEKEVLFAKYQEELNKRMSDLNFDHRYQLAQVELLGSISKVAKEKGFSTVIDASVVYYGNPALDITDAVLAEGNK